MQEKCLKFNEFLYSSPVNTRHQEVHFGSPAALRVSKESFEYAPLYPHGPCAEVGWYRRVSSQAPFPWSTGYPITLVYGLVEEVRGDGGTRWCLWRLKR